MCARDNGVDILLNKQLFKHLEKQGEQKDILEDAILDSNEDGLIAETIRYKNEKQKVEPRFKAGDWIVFNGLTLYVKVVANGFYLTTSKDGITNSYDCSIDNVTRLWTIQDAKDGDALCYKDEISLYKHDIKNCTKQETTFGGFVYHCCYDGKRFIMDSLYSLTEQDKMDIHPATKEQRDTLMKVMSDVGYTFDFEKKELKKIGQKPVEWHREDEQNLNSCLGYIPDEFLRRWLKDIIHAKYDKPAEWSEEDERMVSDIDNCIKNLPIFYETIKINGEDKTTKQFVYCARNWLNSLKDRVQPHVQWKPSDEQMGVIEAVINNRSFQRRHLGSLYEQLKKLRKE